jgi:hypothetical protein
MVHSIKYRVYNTWCTVQSIQYKVYSTWCTGYKVHYAISRNESQNAIILLISTVYLISRNESFFEEMTHKINLWPAKKKKGVSPLLSYKQMLVVSLYMFNYILTFFIFYLFIFVSFYLFIYS